MPAHRCRRSRSEGLHRAAALLLASLAACADVPSEQTIVSDSAGIRVVSNPAPDTPLDWTFTPTVTLGGEEDGPQSFFSVSERTVGVDAAGRIYVLDTDGHRLLVFAGDGTHLRTLGREGEGPGEIAWPIRLNVKPDGTALIKNKSVTGFSNSEEAAVQLTEIVPFLLEDELQSKGANYSKADDWHPYAITDGNLITGQNPQSSELVAEGVLEKLK